MSGKPLLKRCRAARLGAVTLALVAALFCTSARGAEPRRAMNSVLVPSPRPAPPSLVVRAWPSDEDSSRRNHSHGGATLPGAYSVPVWKQPYAYGYFGASPHAKPQRHFGHQRAYTQWAWR